MNIKNIKDGESFLNELYKKLLTDTEQVNHTREPKDSDVVAIKRYMDRLERIHSKADTDTKKALLERYYFDKYITFTYSNEQVQESVRNSHKKRLKMWLDYLSDPASDYPTWAKYWAFQGMLKMGTYDDLKGIYNKRTDHTEETFLDCNPEILAKCINTIIKLVNKEELDEETANALSISDSFNKIYSFYERQYKANIVERSESNEGIWIKYNQGSEEDAHKLHESLDGKNTHWCTGSNVDYALKQVCGPYSDAPEGGDFYVYYSKDKKGEYTIPRIAIRMSGKTKIAEIRGLEDGQNVEEAMIPFIEEKVKSIPDISKEDLAKALDTIKDLKELQEIGRKTFAKEDVSAEELRNFFTKHYGFGWTQDPKHGKILSKRDLRKDFDKIDDKEFECKFIEKNCFNNMIPEKFIRDKGLLKRIVSDGECGALNYIDDALADDKELAIELFSMIDDSYIQFLIRNLSERLQNDPDIMIPVIKRKPRMFEYAGPNIKKDRDLSIWAVKKDPNVIEFLAPNYQEDEEIAFLSVKDQEYPSYHCLLPKFKEQKKFIIESVKNNYTILGHVKDELIDKDVAIAALENNYLASGQLKDRKPELLEDPDVQEALKKADKKYTKGLNKTEKAFHKRARRRIIKRKFERKISNLLGFVSFDKFIKKM